MLGRHERTRRGICDPPFEIAGQEGWPKGVICSYDQVNGVYGERGESAVLRCGPLSSFFGGRRLLAPLLAGDPDW
jgi:hypothetical protein